MQPQEVEGLVANPIRRVVTLLQNMQDKVTAEGKKEEELFEKFMCYCKSGSGDLKKSISDGETKISEDSASLEEKSALSAQLKKDLAEHKGDRKDAKDALAKATALREKEASIFAKDSSDAKTNIAAMGKAIAAIEKGAGGSFLQATSSAVLRRLTVEMDLSSSDRDMLTSFLTSDGGYAPQSGEIVGILKQMKETMEKELADMTATEKAAIADFGALSAAKEKEIAMNTKAIEAKTERKGRVDVEVVDLKETVDDTSKAVAEDKKFLADLKSNCDTKQKEWEVRSKTRADELLALADTIKILNDDDALELFKKTLPSPSLLQLKVSSSAVRKQALKLLRSGAQHDPKLELVMLALRGGQSTNFDKVIKMIDEMVELLGKEQTDDDDKKSYCEAELDKTEDDLKVLENSISDLEKAIDEAKSDVAKLTEELAALASGIKALDKSVGEATETRKEENAEYKASMQADKAAKELIGIAKNRLMKFYNPKLYKPPPKVEMGEEQSIAVNMGSEAAPTVAPSGIAGTGVTAFVQLASDDTEAPAPPPETWGAYQKKGQEQSGVTAMMDLLVADLDKHMTESEVDEKDAQSDYESFMQDAKNKRAADSKSISDKEGVKADLEAKLQDMGKEKKSSLKEAMGVAETLKDLHLECDWLLKNFEARKTARAGEVDSLKKAKAVLSGADYSL